MKVVKEENMKAEILLVIVSLSLAQQAMAYPGWICKDSENLGYTMIIKSNDVPETVSISKSSRKLYEKIPLVSDPQTDGQRYVSPTYHNKLKAPTSLDIRMVFTSVGVATAQVNEVSYLPLLKVSAFNCVSE